MGIRPMNGGQPVRCYIIAMSTVITLSIASINNDALAFKLRPTGTDDEKLITKLESGFFATAWGKLTRWATEHFTHAVHGEITNRIWGCALPEGATYDDEACVTWAQTPPSVIYGVQWNDNPPFKLDSTGLSACTVTEPIRLPDRQPKCWIGLFYNAKKRAAKGEFFTQSNGMALVYRVHFGDMQFLHSMASWNGESMRDTKAKIMMWAEFSYKIAIGEIKPTTKMYELQVPGFKDVLGNYWGDVRSLFTFGVNQYENEIPNVASGSLLHMIEDGFSKSHVGREYPSGICKTQHGAPNAGRVLAFHAFGNQNTGRHGKKDSRKSMLAGLVELKKANVVLVGRHIKQMIEAKTPWKDVQLYLDQCVYAVAKNDRIKPAGPGESFK